MSRVKSILQLNENFSTKKFLELMFKEIKHVIACIFLTCACIPYNMRCIWNISTAADLVYSLVFMHLCNYFLTSYFLYFLSEIVTLIIVLKPGALPYIGIDCDSPWRRWICEAFPNSWTREWYRNSRVNLIFYKLIDLIFISWIIETIGTTFK